MLFHIVAIVWLLFCIQLTRMFDEQKNKIEHKQNKKKVIKSACKFSLEHKLQIFHQQASSI